LSRKGRSRSRRRRAGASRSGGGASPGDKSNGATPDRGTSAARASAVRASAGGASAGATPDAGTSAAATSGASAWRRAVEGARTTPAPRPGGRLGRERPQAPWHPLPLSEILIVVGAVGMVVGLSRGASHGRTPLLFGLIAVALGTIEVTLREHMSGFRSHTLLLAILPIVVFHSVVVLAIGAFGHVTPAINIALLAIDLALFALLFRVLRARFKEAQGRASSGRGAARA
jgi:hypothetical protein